MPVLPQTTHDASSLHLTTATTICIGNHGICYLHATPSKAPTHPPLPPPPRRYMTWDDRYFPNSIAMQEDVASRGRKMVTIVDPHVKRDPGYYMHSEAEKLGHYVKNKDNNDFDGWGPRLLLQCCSAPVCLCAVHAPLLCTQAGVQQCLCCPACAPHQLVLPQLHSTRLALPHRMPGTRLLPPFPRSWCWPSCSYLHSARLALPQDMRPSPMTRLTAYPWLTLCPPPLAAGAGPAPPPTWM